MSAPCQRAQCRGREQHSMLRHFLGWITPHEWAFLAWSRLQCLVIDHEWETARVTIHPWMKTSTDYCARPACWGKTQRVTKEMNT